MQLPNRDQIERAFYERQRELHDRHRRMLRDAMGSPPSIDNVPESFWDDIRREEEIDLIIILAIIFMASSRHHGTPDAIDAGLAWSRQRAAFVADGYARHSRNVLQRVMAPPTPALVGVGVGLPVSPPVTPVRPRRGDVQPEDDAARLKRAEELIFGPKRSERIAVTETTAAQSAGGEHGVDRWGGVHQLDRWIARIDGRQCEICESLHNTTRDVWALRFPNGSPAHTICRCWIHYHNIDMRDQRELPRNVVLPPPTAQGTSA